MSDMSYLDDENMQQFLSWQGDELQWNEATTPGAIMDSNGMPLASLEERTGPDQQLLGSFGSPFSPKTRWHNQNDFNLAYHEQS